MNGTFKKVKLNGKKFLGNALTLAMIVLTATPMFAGTAINSAVQEIDSYKGDVQALIYVVGTIVGLVGGLRIYNKWTNGDQDINKEIVGWGGAALFLFLVPTFIDAIF